MVLNWWLYLLYCTVLWFIVCVRVYSLIGSMRLSRRETPSGSTRRRGRLRPTPGQQLAGTRALHARADRSGRDDGDDSDARKRKRLGCRPMASKPLVNEREGTLPSFWLAGGELSNHRVVAEHGDGVSDRDVAQGQSPIHVLSSTGNLKAINGYSHTAQRGPA